MKIFCIFVLLLVASCSRSLPATVETDASLATAEWLDQKYGIDQSSAVRKLLHRVSDRLGRSVYGMALERENKVALDGELNNYKWDVFLLHDRTPNAFSVGSGMIFVTEGLLARLGSEAELAAVIAHEMSHQLLGHTRAAINEQGLEVKENPAYAYSLDREIEADMLGLKILKVARYDLTHAASALAIGYRETAESAPVPPDWLTTRMAYMHQHIKDMGEFLPATANSREFTKLKNQLFG